MKKYKCLVLDHDDTLVDSTRLVHFPSFVDYLKIYHPTLADKYTLEDYLRKNFSPGVIELFRDEIGMDEEEMQFEEDFWREYVRTHNPRAFPGMKEIIERHISEGGIFVIDSHSFSENIKRDLEYNGIPEPHVIYGWELPHDWRKPSSKTLLDLMERYSLKPSEILVVDDLKPGYDMARGAGVDFAAAGWAYDIPEIEDFMRKNCDYYLKTVEELSDILFG